MSDFGASAILEENLARFTPSSSHLMAGTYNYMPPEVRPATALGTLLLSHHHCYCYCTTTATATAPPLLLLLHHHCYCYCTTTATATALQQHSLLSSPVWFTPLSCTSNPHAHWSLAAGVRSGIIRRWSQQEGRRVECWMHTTRVTDWQSAVGWSQSCKCDEKSLRQRTAPRRTFVRTFRTGTDCEDLLSVSAGVETNDYRACRNVGSKSRST